MDNKTIENILEAVPDQLSDAEVAALLATIATAFSNEIDINALMHLNVASAMVLSRIEHESRTFN